VTLAFSRMTIDSGWVQILKRECPLAFHHKLSCVPTTWFIDGQIKLMKAAWIDTWETFFHRQFVDTIDRALAFGASVVVMGFDDYTHVPQCKSMTQRKRTAKVVTYEYDPAEALPRVPPEDWNAAMRNRNFKINVIKFVVRNLEIHFKTCPKTVVIDWVGAPVVLGRPLALDGRELPVREPGCKRGECDIKAFGWTTWGPTVLQSTDGDFIPLALLQASDSAAPIYLERLMTHLTPAKKRSIDGDRKRQLEYVCISTLLARVSELLPSHASPAGTLATMIALTGCDFCNSMPAIGPAKLWAAKHAARDLDFGSTKGVLAAVTTAYQLNFAKHIRPTRQGDIVSASDEVAQALGMYELVSRNIRNNSATSQKHKDAIWTVTHMHMHVLNVAWTVGEYWTRLGLYADPVCDERYGYKKNAKGSCEFITA
jgi:hypothetical protein